MEPVLSFNEDKPVKSKPGPKAKPAGPTKEEFDILKEAFIKLATLSGHGNHLNEFGMTPWKPEKKDMGKW